MVEHTLGKGEVSGSNPLKSSIAKGRYENICLCFRWFGCVGPPDVLFGFCFWGRLILNKALKNSRQVSIMFGLILLLGQ
ncbi:hypothetical protein ALQ50_02983 [Pseudomonas coronafaciens pv. coronafaciens]|nr:hypothetical protein ALQ50_02983 [Pseudomonas coronafaciens pv. coronafaciens]